MAAAKPPQGRFDVKLAAGGMVDLEFIVHFRQLASGKGLSPELPVALDELIARAIAKRKVATAAFFHGGA